SRRRFKAENRTATVGMRFLNLIVDQLFNGGARSNAFERAGLGIEPPQCAKLLVAAKPGFLHGGLQDANGFVIDLDRNGIGMPILAAMGERKPRGIGKAE